MLMCIFLISLKNLELGDPGERVIHYWHGTVCHRFASVFRKFSLQFFFTLEAARHKRQVDNTQAQAGVPAAAPANSVPVQVKKILNSVTRLR